MFLQHPCLFRVHVGTVGMNGVCLYYVRTLLQRIFLARTCVYQACMPASPGTHQSLISPCLSVTRTPYWLSDLCVDGNVERPKSLFWPLTGKDEWIVCVCVCGGWGCNYIFFLSFTCSRGTPPPFVSTIFSFLLDHSSLTDQLTWLKYSMCVWLYLDIWLHKHSVCNSF